MTKILSFCFETEFCLNYLVRVSVCMSVSMFVTVSVCQGYAHTIVMCGGFESWLLPATLLVLGLSCFCHCSLYSRLTGPRDSVSFLSLTPILPQECWDLGVYHCIWISHEFQDWTQVHEARAFTLRVSVLPRLAFTISLLNGWTASLYYHAQLPKTFCWCGGGPHVAQLGLRLAMPRFPYHWDLRAGIIGLCHYTQIYVVWELNPGIYVCYATSY